jgi:hypothetical protein
MEAACYSETSVDIYHFKLRHASEDSNIICCISFLSLISVRQMFESSAFVNYVTPCSLAMQGANRTNVWKFELVLGYFCGWWHYGRSVIKLSTGVSSIPQHRLLQCNTKLTTVFKKKWSRNSDGLWPRRPGLDFRQGQEIFLYSTVSRPALVPTESPIQWEPAVNLTSHLYLMPRSRMVYLYL